MSLLNTHTTIRLSAPTQSDQYDHDQSSLAEVAQEKSAVATSTSTEDLAVNGVLDKKQSAKPAPTIDGFAAFQVHKSRQFITMGQAAKQKLIGKLVFESYER